jgi:hypothetical protein
MLSTRLAQPKVEDYLQTQNTNPTLRRLLDVYFQKENQKPNIVIMEANPEDTAWVLFLQINF